MGTKMVPAYANLFMGNLELILQKLGHNHVKLWKKFIDDIYIHRMDGFKRRTY